MRCLWLLLALLVIAASGCGPQKKEAGEPCTPGNGAKCDSNICLQHDCGGVARFVCAGEPCSPQADDCDDPSQSCVRTQAGSAYCLPFDVCDR